MQMILKKISMESGITSDAQCVKTVVLALHKRVIKNPQTSLMNHFFSVRSTMILDSELLGRKRSTKEQVAGARVSMLPSPLLIPFAFPHLRQ